MSDLISRQDAIDAVNDCGICIQKILDLPSAEPKNECEKCIFNPFKQFNPERRTGKWIGGDENYGKKWFKCSVCDEPIVIPTRMGKALYDYCPNCGARMKGEQNDNN